MSNPERLEYVKNENSSHYGVVYELRHRVVYMPFVVLVYMNRINNSKR